MLAIQSRLSKSGFLLLLPWSSTRQILPLIKLVLFLGCLVQMQDLGMTVVCIWKCKFNLALSQVWGIKAMGHLLPTSLQQHAKNKKKLKIDAFDQANEVILMILKAYLLILLVKINQNFLSKTEFTGINSTSLPYSIAYCWYLTLFAQSK